MKKSIIQKITSRFMVASALLGSSALFGNPALAAGEHKDEKARVVEFHTEVVDGKTSWVPAKVTVHAGEKLTLKFKHELKTGPDFHGVNIPELKIKEKVDRNKERSFSVEIPKDLKEKQLTISCQFHPTHQPAAMVLESP